MSSDNAWEFWSGFFLPIIRFVLEIIPAIFGFAWQAVADGFSRGMDFYDWNIGK